jgi:hypothetical protein
MSTTFGVKIPSTGEIKPIAKRSGGSVWFTEPLAELLPHNLLVIPMDNEAQGIRTVGGLYKQQTLRVCVNNEQPTQHPPSA